MEILEPGDGVGVFLQDRDHASLRAAAASMCNGTFGRYCQDDDPESPVRASDEFLRRLDESVAIREMCSDGTFSVWTLEKILWAVVEAFAAMLHQDSLKLPPESVDRMSPGVARSDIESAVSALEEAAVRLLIPIPGVGFDELLTDDGAVVRILQVADLYRSALRYRDNRESARTLRRSGETGMRPEPATILAVGVDEALAERKPKERHTWSRRLADEFLDVQLSEEQVRQRVKDFARRRDRKNSGR